MAQKWRMARYGAENKRPALDQQALRDIALAYVGRYATSRARLSRYLVRKLRERGWNGEDEPDVAGLTARFCELGYVDDAAFARMKGASMGRRGLGVARVRSALAADGIGEIDRAAAEEQARAESWTAAETLARKKRIGPYAANRADPRQRERQIAMFLRAGHGFDTARVWVDAAPGELPERDD